MPQAALRSDEALQSRRAWPNSAAGAHCLPAPAATLPCLSATVMSKAAAVA